MKLPNFSIVTAPPDTLILHGGEFPYHFARVLKYPSHVDMALSKKPLIHEVVPGYNIIIALSGSMEGRIHFSAYGPGKLQALVKDMAEWFTEEQINKQVTKFAKYRLTAGRS